MTEQIYHKEIYLPSSILDEVLEFHGQILAMSVHALTAAMNDVYGSFVIPAYFAVNANEVIEVEVYEDEITKVMFRVPNIQDPSLHICVVVMIPNMIVKTSWQNEREDTHSQLIVSKYEQPPMNNTFCPSCGAPEDAFVHNYGCPDMLTNTQPLEVK